MEHLRKLPGVGQKSAERFAFRLLSWEEKELEAFGTTLSELKKNISFCRECGAISAENRCFYCNDPGRNQRLLCIVAHPKDVFSLEETGSFRGVYHVLGGVISPMYGFDTSSLRIDALKERIASGTFEEIVLALDSTIEGDATTLFMKKELSSFPGKISRLAFGIPVGSSFEYIDGSTLSKAFTGRLGF